MWRLVLVVLLAAAVTAPASAQDGLGGRRQWQPVTDSVDTRLYQRVHLEILGRPLGPVLDILSKSTGVSLTIAPEDAEALGDRKATVIAQGCQLDSVMVQLTQVLPELHWDVDPSGEAPVYLVHRNSDAHEGLGSLIADERRRRAEASRTAREVRIEAARKALAMTPAELDELAKTDPLLAGAVQQADTKPLLEYLVDMPPELLDELRAEGRVDMDYSTLPPPLQEHIEVWMHRNDNQSGDEQQMTLHQILVDNLPWTQLQYTDMSMLSIPGMSGGNPQFHFFVVYKMPPQPGEQEFSSSVCTGDSVLPPQYPPGDSPNTHDRNLARFVPDSLAGDLNAKTDAAEAARRKAAQTTEVIENLRRKAIELRAQQAADRRAKEWVAPEDRALLHRVQFPSDKPLPLIEEQQFLARETGLSVIADYFTGAAKPLPKEAAEGAPLWQVLNLLGEQHEVNWVMRGKLLVFFHPTWFELAQTEVPESLLVACRQSLEERGHLSVDDLCKIAKLIPGVPREDALPEDLRPAGLTYSSLLLGGLGLRFYDTLSPDQRAGARNATGLSYADMTAEQQRQAVQLKFGAPGDGTNACFRLTETARPDGGQTCSMTLHFGDALPYSYTFQFPKVQLGE